MLDIVSEREVEGDLLLSDMGQGSAIQPGVIDGAISISSFQWLSNAVKSSHQPRLRLKDFFRSLYRRLARGARAVFHAYPKNLAQRELILRSAMHAGFAGGVVVNYAIDHMLWCSFRKSYQIVGAAWSVVQVFLLDQIEASSVITKNRKEYLVLAFGSPSLSTAVHRGKGEDGESDSDDNTSGDENQTVRTSDRHRPGKMQKITKKGKGKEWILKKKEQMRKKGKHCAS